MDFIRINAADNVAVAIHDVEAGASFDINGVSIITQTKVPAGHKVALEDMDEGADIIKYGFPIGHLLAPVQKGGLIDHTNLKTNLEGLLDYTYEPDLTETKPADTPAYFKGYRRKDGRAGVRNELWIIPTVGCVNGVVQNIQKLFEKELDQYPSIEKVIAFPHNYGCSQLGGDHENTRNILADMVHHPNAAGVLVVALGCENNQLGAFRELVGPVDETRVKFMESQKIQGDEVEYGLGLLREIAAAAKDDRREDVPVSELKVGLKCGGSDGFSGITANPLLGRFSDWVVAQGGTTVLTEVPEMFGAETILMARCQDEATFDRTVHLINDFKAYFMKNDQPVYENPSPGNKAGGISTLEEKSLGCVQKGGSAPVTDVISYGDTVTKPGLTLLDGPGNDIVSITNLSAAGCHLVLFTTGRGTPLGGAVPTIKIASNDMIASKKPHWIDFSAFGDKYERAQELLKLICRVADGEETKNEALGNREIAIFKDGVTL